MSRGLKTRTPISNAVNTELYEQLKALSGETMIPISKLLDKGIDLVLEEYKKSN
ncbi:MAG TPA: ribbon-helix-helix domain-containing protein [Bacteroidales bacterium]|nr:ribbon-helix-helix domain-containing protein [Bacteroidales bacterium]